MTQLALDRRPDTARFSPCGLYRYELTRELGGGATLVSIGLNPSIADADKNDPTIRKDIGFAQRWGLGRVAKYNANAYCATDPKSMLRAAKAGVDVIGPDNDRTLRIAAAAARDGGGKIVVSWGANIDGERQREIAAILTDFVNPPTLWCFGTNLDGSPVHELYQPWTRELVEWRCP